MLRNSFAVEPLAPAIGAEIQGIDLGQGVDDALFGRLHQALMDHQVIFLRDQTIDPDQHVDLARRFGPPLPSKKLKLYGDRYDCLSLLENDGTKVAVGSMWHTDNTDFEEPPMGSLLYCEVAPKVGGDTLFASMYAAFEALDRRTQAYLETLTAQHDNANGPQGGGKPQPAAHAVRACAEDGVPVPLPLAQRVAGDLGQSLHPALRARRLQGTAPHASGADRRYAAAALAVASLHPIRQQSGRSIS
jgi:alpha-ketoglutarate-dependent taurine dioxygenase